MNSSKAKIAVGCTVALAIPLLLIFAVFVYAATGALMAVNESRAERHMSWGQVIEEWRKESAGEEARLTAAERDRRDMNSSAKMMACPFAIFIVGGYFVPLLIAMRRKHPQVAAIGAVNIFLGWSFLGWVIALAWSLTNENQSALPIPPISPELPRPRSVAPLRPPTSPF
jgi:T4 superinfection immunity protein